MADWHVAKLAHERLLASASRSEVNDLNEEKECDAVYETGEAGETGVWISSTVSALPKLSSLPSLLDSDASLTREDCEFERE
jgi:hypothetical protein